MKIRDKTNGTFVRTLTEKKCSQCENTFSPRNSFSKFCSNECRYKALIGKESLKKNGEVIKCKTCDEKFYISGSRIGYKKYCSRECAKIDDFGFVPYSKKCKWCVDSFVVEKTLRSGDKYCSELCKKEAFSEKQKERYTRLKTETVIGKCKNCKTEFNFTAYFKRIYCTKKCQSEYTSKTRKGKNNPNYTGGLYLNTKRNSRQATIHLGACSKYRKAFLKKNDYLYCEVCNVNSNGTPKFEVHHIYFASKYPRHKNLHDFKNLILICLECHHNFHRGKTYHEKFLEIEKTRGLKELFNN